MLIPSDSELSPMMMSSESSVVPCQPHGTDREVMSAAGTYQDFPDSPQMTQHVQRLHGPLHQWDINDNALPTPETHDPFELWPSGHSRRVYRADSDDARRHVSGWAMRNTNNHNALILKKSCLGVLVCSADCLLESGRKVHLRPAICDKARRKQIGRPCPNAGCPGKLDLLSCRGHCGYPVTHFWRHVNGYVYFQAKGFHDHPRPEVKSLSEKGRHAFTKHLKQEGDHLSQASLKRRFPILTNEDIPDRKMFISSKDEVMCSCPPFECVCPKSHSGVVHTSLGYLKESHGPHYLPHRAHHGVGAGMEQLAAAPFTQINITNTCLPPSSVDVSIPGYDLYTNCPRFGFRQHCLDSEMKMFNSHNTKEDNMSPLHAQNRGLFKSSQGGPSSSLLHGYNPCVSPRTVSTEDVEDFSRFRLCTDARGQLIKNEPSFSNCSNSSPSLPTQSSRTYQTDMYQTLSPTYQPHTPPSPHQLDECQVKFNSAPEEDFSKEQDDRQQEPTYITLTSPQRHVEDSNDEREYNSCRLSHVNRSPGTTSSPLDNVLYLPQPSQVTRVDNVSLHSHRPLLQREACPGGHMSHLRRSPTSLRQTLGSPDALNTMGSFQRGSNSSVNYGSSTVHHDPSTSPFQINNDPSLSNYPNPSSNYGNISTPYGYYCNEMFPNSSQQTYRNRSINITLTYN